MRREALIVAQDRRHDAGGAVGRRGDDAAAGGILLVHRERPEIDPVEHRQRVLQRALGALHQQAVERGRAALHLEAAGRMPSWPMPRSMQADMASTIASRRRSISSSE
jgi:hypothetical protein